MRNALPMRRPGVIGSAMYGFIGNSGATSVTLVGGSTKNSLVTAKHDHASRRKRVHEQCCCSTRRRKSKDAPAVLDRDAKASVVERRVRLEEEQEQVPDRSLPHDVAVARERVHPLAHATRVRWQRARWHKVSTACERDRVAPRVERPQVLVAARLNRASHWCMSLCTANERS